jgi:threonine dehydrogenase-like Zn-dependent dehydrogenase
MKAFFIQEPGQTRIAEVAKPAPGSGEALLRVRAVGLCGTDINSFRGKNPLVSYPRIPGHEISAVIDLPGAGAPQALRAGTPVTVSPYTGCGNCASCRRGRSNACRFNQTLGVQRDGALAEFIAVPWEKIYVAPGLSPRELCLVEPLSVGFHAMDRGRVAPEDVVTVLGCGGVGLGAIAAAAFRKAITIAVDVDDAKLDLARKAGAAHTIHTRREDLHERLQTLTNGHGPDVIVEAIGLPETFRAAVEEVAFTGRVVYIGYTKEPVAYETRLFVQKELDILGSRNATAKDFEGVIQMLLQRKFPVEDMITRVAPLDQAGEALTAWHGNPAAVSKILIQVSST